MVRGRKPKPTPLKLITGNPGKRTIPKSEPAPRAAMSPKCPVWLSTDGQKIWKAIVPELRALGLLTVIDLGCLEGYCANYARAIQAERDLKKEKDAKKRRSLAATAKECWTLVRAFASEFGMSAASRTKVQAKERGPGAALEDWQNSA